MKKFIVLYMSPVSAQEQMQNTSPKEMKKGMEPWMKWFEKSGSALVDGGTPLGKGLHVTKNGTSKSESHVSGYSIVQAEDMEAAKALVTEHPHLMMPEASIEILEMLPMPGM